MAAHQASRPWDCLGKNTGSGVPFPSPTHEWKVKVKSLSHIRLFLTAWTVAYQASPSMGVSRQKYWSGLPLPSPMSYAKAYQWVKDFLDPNKKYTFGHSLEPDD